MFAKRLNSLKYLKRYYCSELPRITPVPLSYASYENVKTTNSPPLLIIPGYLASKQNWVSACKRFLAETKPQRKVIAVDLRNHGDSPHTKEHTNLHVVEDIKLFLETNQYESAAILGHSYGGLCGMLLALTYPDLVDRLIVEDMSPTDQTKTFQGVKDVLDAAANITIPPQASMSTARTLADQQLKKLVPDEQSREFLLTQLVQKLNEKYSWRFNMKVLREVVMNLTILPPDIQGKTYEEITLFIGGTKSPILKKSEEIDIRTFFPNAKFQYIEGAGHVVHMDKPTEFFKICTDFLNRQI